MGHAWDALQFATAESNPDNLSFVSADHGVLYLLRRTHYRVLVAIG